MCGIAGYAGYEAGFQERDMFKEHLWMMAIRGYQSTGVAAICQAGTKTVKVKVRKECRSSANFIFSTLNDRQSYHYDTNDLVMGHTRWPTKGDVTIENAHPFEHGDLVGCHNGSVMGYAKDGKTDSEMLIKEMSEIGVKESLEKLSTLDAFAVVIYDKRTNKLYLARNKFRPLFVGIDQDRHVIHWGSDKNILNCIANRVKDKETTYAPCILEIHNLTPLTLYEIPLEKIRKNTIPWTETTFTTKTFATKPSKNFGRIFEGDGPFLDDFEDNVNARPLGASTLTADIAGALSPEGKSDNVIRMHRVAEKPQRICCACCNNVIPKRDLAEIVTFGAGGKTYYMCLQCDPPLTKEQKERKRNPQ